MNFILKKDNCLATINDRPRDFIDNDKWNEMDRNVVANLHLTLADEILSSIEKKKMINDI